MGRSEREDEREKRRKKTHSFLSLFVLPIPSSKTEFDLENDQ